MKKGFILALIIGLCLTLSAQVYGSGFVSHNPEPVITDFTNATHDHADAAGGGTVSVATAGAITDQGGGNNLKVKIIEIGDWNMDTDATKTVAHELNLANIRPPVIAMIIKDDGAFFHPLTLGINVATPADGYLQNINATNINLVRKTGGIYDTTDYDSTSYNRGWITVWYTE